MAPNRRGFEGRWRRRWSRLFFDRWCVAIFCNLKSTMQLNAFSGVSPSLNNFLRWLCRFFHYHPLASLTVDANMNVLKRASGGSDSTDQFLNLIADPFQAEVRPFPHFFIFMPFFEHLLRAPTKIGTNKLHIRRHRLRLRPFRRPLPPLLHPSTPQFPRLCSTG